MNKILLTIVFILGIVAIDQGIALRRLDHFVKVQNVIVNDYWQYCMGGK
jgi:hypothetical protein